MMEQRDTQLDPHVCQRILITPWPRLMNPTMLAKYLGLARSTVYNNRFMIPGRRKLGRKVLYDRKEVDEWIDASDGLRDLWVDAALILDLSR